MAQNNVWLYTLRLLYTFADLKKDWKIDAKYSYDIKIFEFFRGFQNHFAKNSPLWPRD